MDFSYHLEADKSWEGRELRLISYLKPQFNKVYKKGLTCEEIEANSPKVVEGRNPNNRLVKFDCSTDKCVYHLEAPTSGQYLRFWYYALMVPCSSGRFAEPIEIEYESHFTNYDMSKWNSEIGVDSNGLNSFFLAFFFFFVIFCCVHFYGVKVLSAKLSYIHPMVKLFAVDVMLELVFVVCLMLHWGIYSQNGVGLPGLKTVGNVSEGVGRVLFMLILILLAQGWTISTDELSGKKVLIGVLVGFLVVHFLTMIYKFSLADPFSTQLSDLLAAILWIEVMMFTAFAAFFVYSVTKSFRQEDNPVKRTLYRNLGIIFIPWFCLYPLVTFLILAGSPGFDDLSREPASQFAGGVSSCLGYVFLSFLMWPSRAEEYFNIDKPNVMTANIDTYEQL